MMKVLAGPRGASRTVGTNPRARGRRGESQADFYRRSGSAFGRRITAVNNQRVRNMTTNR